MAQYKGPASESQRAMHLQKKRERHQEDIEIKRKKLSDELKVGKMESKFSSRIDQVDNDLKTSTVGLLTMEEMKTRQENALKEREKMLARKDLERQEEIQKNEKHKLELRLKRKSQIKTLSFNLDEDEEEDSDESTNSEKDEKLKPEDESESKSKDEGPKEIIDEGDEKSKKRLGKDPGVDTSFLPDVDRDEAENKLREELRQKWVEKQKALKDESINIVYSYWDGWGHRRSLTMKKGKTIYQFLQKALETLRPDFPDLKVVTADQLMYVKEDLIIPQTNSFYDFIVTKARGKSGPLFNFDVHDDVRLMSDHRLEKDESHAGKVVLRSWYERNKHIFPASRWEPYDPSKTYDKYTVGDALKKKLPVHGVEMEDETEILIHLKIDEGRRFSSDCNKLVLKIRFMGWEWEEESSFDGPRPKWSLNNCLNPYPLNKFIERVKDNHLVIETVHPDHFHGISFLPLSSFYSALEAGHERILSDNYPYPIISFNDWIKVRDVLSEGSELGQLKVQLVAGSEQQIKNYIKFYGYDEQIIKSKDELLNTSDNFTSKEVSLISVDDKNRTNNPDDMSIDVTILEGKNLPYLKDRVKPLPNSYVSFENKFYSSIQFETCSPVWNFSVKGVPLKHDKKYQIVRLWHSNLNTSDEALGFAAIDLFPNGDKLESIDGWYNVIDLSGRLKAEIKVQIIPSKYISNNLKARLNLKNDLNQVCSLDFESLRLKDPLSNDIPDLGEIDWECVLNSDTGGDTRRTADGQSSIHLNKDS
ncbi:FAM50 [Lepeophtheirus salmonis]|uniref:Protein FAM50 homolog n=1 Tax=Lepeophtheirus salmonis TaxID=72036 RepID=A0A7R8CYQ8_LEPSM|nr:FAM50 [Lepeophtheirus salmonis]CAF2943541.1 FAM50 [Lepeophtheirus salmonis]